MANIVRHCRSCTACCTALGIHELGKRPGEKCWRQIGKGCSIYKTRPKACADYSCQWLQGRFLMTERPDRAGFLCNPVSETVRFTQETGLALFNAFKLAPGELPSVGQALFGKIARANILTFDGRVYGPPDKLPRALEWIEKNAEALNMKGAQA